MTLQVDSIGRVDVVEGALQAALVEPAPALSATHDKPYPWIINPVFDLIFVCGLGVFGLIAFNSMFIGWAVPMRFDSPASIMLLTAIYLSQHIFADAHNTATYMRLWGSSADRQRFRFHRTWLVYSCVPLFVLGLMYPKFTGTLVYLYLVSVFWHYAAQAFGISLIYCYKRGYRLTRGEKQVFKWFMLSMSGVVIIRMFTLPNYSPRFFFGVELPQWGMLPVACFYGMVAIFSILGLMFGSIVMRKLAMDRQMLPLPACLLILTVACLGLSSGVTSAIFWLYAPAFYHGSQYLAVSLSYYLKEQGMPNGMNTWKIARLLFTSAAGKYIGIVIVTGVFFYIGIPHFFMQLGFNYVLVSGLMLAVINYHHFITDAAIWRLRDERCRKILLA